MTDTLDLDARRAAVRDLSVAEIADAIQDIGFECTRCGACCRGEGDEHTATIFPDEVRAIAEREAYDWRDVARPMPYGLAPDGTGDTVEWALQTDGCGDCRFLEEEGDGTACSVYGDRPMICRTYPFTLTASPGGDPLGAAVERAGPVTAHECEGLGRPIDRASAVELARALKRRAARSIEEAEAVRSNLDGGTPDATTVVVDSEGPKHPDGTPIDDPETGQR